MKTQFSNLLKPAFWLPCLILILAALACRRENTVAEVKPKPDQPYDMRSTAPNLSVLQGAIEHQPMYGKLKHELDFAQVQSLQSNTEDVSVYVIKLKGKDQYYGVKLGGSIATAEILFSRKIVDAQNGSIGLLKGNESLIINYDNGKRTIRGMTENEYNVHFTKEYHGGTGFCQREPGESFADCYNAETNEFCDSFISCIALATNPQVQILIGLACSCGASMPASKTIL